jgi:S-methylmethionine-dependent homocysteine/selenocysteine methylase
VSKITLIDGPMGTLLEEKGVQMGHPSWSGAAIRSYPHLIQEVHREYVEAGATVHTANTFRTRQRDLGEHWKELTKTAIVLAQEAVPAEQQVAASIAPLADCYRPDLSPERPRAEHREFIRFIADQNVDLLLCETFTHAGEALIAVHECVSTGLPTWLSLCAGPHAELLSPSKIRHIAVRAIDLGAEAVLVNCVDAAKTAAYVSQLADLGVPFGAYANAGPPAAGLGWHHSPQGPERYLAYAREWVNAGATLLGSCCGTRPAHVAILKKAFRTD